MVRKLWLSFLTAGLGILLLAAGVTAQTVDEDAELDGPTVLPVTQPVSVTTPFTLTILVPSAGGPLTVEVPIMLQLSMSITLGSDLTPTVASTPTIGIVEASTVPEAGSTDATDTGAADEIEQIPIATATAPAVPTVEPTATPDTLPTATPTAATSEAAATATPVPEEAATETPAETTGAAEDDTGGEPVTIAPVCPDSRSVISSPGVNQVVSGNVDITGTAVHENFQYYKIEYAEGADPDNTAGYAYLTDGRVQVSDGLLASFDSTEFANGTYTLRLSVVDNTGNFPPPCAVTIVIQN